MKPMVLCGLAMIASTLSACGPGAEAEIHRLPEGFTGPVIIVFGQPEGQGEKYENGVRIYDIPPDGVLKTQFQQVYGSREVKYFRRMPDGSYETIPVSRIGAAPTGTNRAYVFGLEGGKIYKTDSASSPGEEDEVAFQYQRYLVGQPNSADSLGRIAEMMFREIESAH